MRYQFASVVLVGGLFLGLCSDGARAQIDAPFDPSTIQQDAQLFAPAEMDLDGLPIGNYTKGGFFFNYDKLYWNIEGNLTTVGKPGLQRALPPVWTDTIQPVNPFTGLIQGFLAGQPVDPITGRVINPDTQLPIERPLLSNTIQNTLPDASFRGGGRIEFGYNNEDRGWSISILQGPKQQGTHVFGTNGGIQEGQGGFSSPIGDVYIAFDYQPGLMHGFQDLIIGGIGTGRVLPTDTDGDGVLDGDGIADDVDGDGQFGPDGLDLVAPGAIPEAFPIPPVPGALFPAVWSNLGDYGDLVELPTAFKQVVVRNATNLSGVELMAMERLDKRHWMAKNQPYNQVDFSYGVRYLRFRDNFIVFGDGGVLGQSVWNTQITNNLIGPQLGLEWTHSRARWTADLSGRFMFGYNVSNWDQDGFIGEDLTPGRLNHPLYLRAHSFRYGRQDNEFAPVAEMRWQVSYALAKSVALKAGWTGMYVGDIYRASTHIKYSLPDMGFLVNNPEKIIAQGGNFGIEFNY